VDRHAYVGGLCLSALTELASKLDSDVRDNQTALAAAAGNNEMCGDDPAGSNACLRPKIFQKFARHTALAHHSQREGSLPQTNRASAFVSQKLEGGGRIPACENFYVT